MNTMDPDLGFTSPHYAFERGTFFPCRSVPRRHTSSPLSTVKEMPCSTLAFAVVCIKIFYFEKHSFYTLRFTQIGIFHLLIVFNIVGSARCQNLPVMEHCDSVGQRKHHVHVMFDDHQCLPLGEGADQLDRRVGFVTRTYRRSVRRGMTRSGSEATPYRIPVSGSSHRTARKRGNPSRHTIEPLQDVVCFFRNVMKVVDEAPHIEADAPL